MIRGLWSRETIGWVVVIALLAPAAVVLVTQGAPGLGRMALAFVVSALWLGVFRILHHMPLSPTPAVMAVAIAVLAPEVGVMDLVLGVSFGIVLGELVFGGWGRNVIAAPVAALAMLFLSHPGVLPPEPEATMLVAAAVTGAILLATGILALAVVLPALLGAVLVALLLGVPATDLLLAAPFVLGLVLLIGDPVAAPGTYLARIAYGLLAGGLAALLTGAGGAEAAARATVFAALIAQIFAPALDAAGLALFRTLRSRRHV